MNAAAFLERVVWTFVQAFCAGLVGIPLFDIDAWQAAALAGLAAVINVLTQFARYRLSVLPDPGGGLPGLPSDA